jgi:cation:H+ antiporter
MLWENTIDDPSRTSYVMTKGTHSNMLAFLQVIVGLAVLVAGGEGLVRGAVALARNLGVSTIVIGLTIVSFGTSAPELVISVQSVLDGYPDIALGNIVGSNIANILLVVGLASIVYPIAVDPKLTKRDAPIMLAVSIVFVLMSLDGLVSRFDAGILLTFLALYTWFSFYLARKGKNPELLEELEEETDIHMKNGKAILFIGFGLVALIAGSSILVDGSVTLARLIGVSEAVIGLTVLAIGSSAPELITSLVAAYRKHSDIALANVVGSNLFNLAAIGGVAAMVVPMEVSDQFIQVDYWVMLAVTILLLPFMITGMKLVRVEGVCLFGGYIAYTFWQYYNGLTAA